jgi:hypothetical protein
MRSLMQTMSAESLKLLEGIEYEVDALSTDEYFLIRKSYRVDPSTTHLLALYYVIGVDNATGDPQMLPRGTVVPMPDLHSVLKTNLSTSFLFIKSAFEELNQHVAFHPAVHGYQWSVADHAALRRRHAHMLTSNLSLTVRALPCGALLCREFNQPSTGDKDGEKKDDAAAAAAASLTVAAPPLQPRHQFSALIDNAILNISQPLRSPTQQQR